MRDDYILLNYYTNLDLLLDRFIAFLVIFLFLLVGSITRNIILKPILTRKQILIASLFNAIIFSFLSKKLIDIFNVYFFPIMLGIGLIQKEFIEGLMNSELLKKFKKTIYQEKDKNKKH